MTESCGVALIYVRRSMVRYDEDRASPERRFPGQQAPPSTPR